MPKPIVTKLHPSLYFRQAKALAGVGVPGAEKPDEESEEALERKKRKAALKKLKKKKKRSSASAASKSLLHSLRTGKSVRGSGRGRGTRR